MSFTIFGSTGFIGSSLVERLKSENIDVFRPERNFTPDPKKNYGHIVYCIGLTSDFRENIFETIDAHISYLNSILKECQYESFLYLSSTRVYNGLDGSNEDSRFLIDPSNLSDLYNLSKLMGESICLSIENKNVRVARLSNVIGENFDSDNFIYSLIKDAVDKGKIELLQSIKVERDYIPIESVVDLLIKISVEGNDRIYNVSNGINFSNENIIGIIKENTHCNFNFGEDNQEKLHFPIICNKKIMNEFDYMPKQIDKEIEQLIEYYKKKKYYDTDR